MPKASRKTEQLRVTTEEPSDNNAVISDDEHGGHLTQPGLSTDALLKYIAEVVAKEGQRSQKMFNDAFAKFEARLDEKVDTIVKRVEVVAAASEALAERQTGAEARISALEDDTSLMKQKLDVMGKHITELTDKIMDLEGRSRRDNIRILNLKESVEGSTPLQFFEEFIPKLLGLPVASIAIDRVHRGLGVPSPGRPRPVIAKIHRPRDVAMILSTARRVGTFQYEGQSIRISPDLPPAVRMARRAFNPICTELIQRNIRFQMSFPAILSFKLNGVQKSFRSSKDAKAFLEENG